jgi:hypothetical protein
MKHIQFYSKKYKVISIPRKTKASGFCNIKEGDYLTFKIVLLNTTGASGGGVYTNEIDIIHESNSSISRWENSQNHFLNNIKKFKLEEIKDVK